MKKTPWLMVEPFRQQHPILPQSHYGDDYGFFVINGPCGQPLAVIANAADADGWDHVSISLKNRCPNWTEMCFVKDLFFEPEETVMQLHPPQV